MVCNIKHFSLSYMYCIVLYMSLALNPKSCGRAQIFFLIFFLKCRIYLWRGHGGVHWGILHWGRQALSAYTLTWCVSGKGPLNWWLHRIGNDQCSDDIEDLRPQNGENGENGAINGGK